MRIVLVAYAWGEGEGVSENFGVLTVKWVKLNLQLTVLYIICTNEN